MAMGFKKGYRASTGAAGTAVGKGLATTERLLVSNSTSDTGTGRRQIGAAAAMPARRQSWRLSLSLAGGTKPNSSAGSRGPSLLPAPGSRPRGRPHLLALPRPRPDTFRARAPKAAGLPQSALAVLPGARGLRPLDAFPGARGVKHNAAGPECFPGLASPTRGLAGSDPVQPASVVLSLRRRRPAPDRFPWRKAPTVRQCERPNELRGLPSPEFGPLASAPPLRPIPPDFSDRRPPALPGRRRLPGARRAAPRTLGTPPIGLGSPAAALPPHRFASAAELDAPIAHDSASAARDSARPRGFKQGDGQAAEPAMPANHPHDLHRPGSPRIGSRSSLFGAYPPTADQACTPAPPTSPALAPGRSPMASRLTSFQPQPRTRPVEPALSDRDRLALPGATSAATAAARIGEPCSATATPGTCRESGARRGAEATPKPRSTTAGIVDSSRGAVTRQGAVLAASPQGLTATAAHNLPRSAGRVAHLASTDPRTPAGAPRPADLPANAVSAWTLAPTTGTIASLSSFATHFPLPNEAGRWAGGSGGEGETSVTDLFAAPATDPQSRVGLIEQSKRPAGDGFPVRPQSTKAGRANPAGVPTQGDM